MARARHTVLQLKLELIATPSAYHLGSDHWGQDARAAELPAHMTQTICCKQYAAKFENTDAPEALSLLINAWTITSLLRVLDDS